MSVQPKIGEILSTKTASSFESDAEIEDVLGYIYHTVDKKIAFLEKLKKNRIQCINREIEKLEFQKELLKDSIVATLRQFGHKSLSFPGVGRVSIRTKKMKWVVKDDEELLKELKQLIPSDEWVTITESKTRFIKQNLDAFLAGMDSRGEKLPGSVEKIEAGEMLAISIDESINQMVIPEEKEDDSLYDTAETF
jgi:hypothetical protein